MKIPEAVVYFTMLAFLFIFPKAGFQIGAFPIYIGFILLVLVTAYNTVKYEYKLDLDIFAIFVFWYALRIIIDVCFEGIHFDQEFAANTIGYPLGIMFMFVQKEYIKKYGEKIFRFIYYCGIIVVLFGFYQLLVGIDESIIPGLTFNYTQYINGANYFWKSNDFMGIYKLPSTYHNGNMYGLFLIGYYPIFCYFAREKAFIFKILGKAAIIFSIFRTLSRTAIFTFLIFMIFHTLLYIYHRLYNKDVDHLGQGAFGRSRHSKSRVIGGLLCGMAFLGILFWKRNELLSHVIFQRIFGYFREIDLTFAGRFTSSRVAFSSIREIFIGNLNYWNESYYLSTIHVFGAFMGILLILILLNIGVQLFQKVYKPREDSLLIYYVGFSFINLSVAGIADLGWGHFPIEMHYWLYLSYIVFILAEKHTMKSKVSS